MQTPSVAIAVNLLQHCLYYVRTVQQEVNGATLKIYGVLSIRINWHPL